MADLKPFSPDALDPHLWVDLYSDYLYSFAILRIKDPELAKDLVQETFLAGLEKIASFKGKSSERTWLTAILKYKIIDVYRRSSSGVERKGEQVLAEEQYQNFFDPFSGHWNALHSPTPSNVFREDPFYDQELAQVLRRCMDKLPELWLSVFTLKHVEEMDTGTICEELKITASNFWVVVHRAKLNLRACLQKSWL